MLTGKWQFKTEWREAVKKHERLKAGLLLKPEEKLGTAKAGWLASSCATGTLGFNLLRSSMLFLVQIYFGVVFSFPVKPLL